MIFSDLPSPAEASSRMIGPREGFAQAGKPVSTFRDHALTLVYNSSGHLLVRETVVLQLADRAEEKGWCVATEPLIAVIDDDDSFRIALVESLCSLGYGVRDFACAEDFIAAALTSLHERPYDCIITDIHMPGMSGIDLKRLLVARACRIPVIMTTARSEPGLEARAAASGCASLLRKPFETDALVGCLERALRA
jgi:CheY-like chemotaxis protein